MTQENAEETCVKCGRQIFPNEGRYRFGGGAATHCAECGDLVNDYKTGIVL